MGCSREEILNMEKQMLQKLQYDLTVPTAYNFLARFKKAANVQDVQKVGHILISKILDYCMVMSLSAWAPTLHVHDCMP